MSTQSNIRIIGGKWRSRKVSFETKDILRPTPDRVRETLFNWLAPHIVGATCLDLYAGSGVLGLEAISRGAAAVTTVERDHDCVDQIKKNKITLDAEELSIVNKSVLDFLASNGSPIDLVFVDPPYKDGLLIDTLHALENNHWLHKDSLIYFELDQPIDQNLLPASWKFWRESKAGRVYYYLAIKEQ